MDHYSPLGKMSQKPRGQIDELSLTKAWCDWNLKSLNKYLEAILKLSPEDRIKDRGASWGSVQNIFLHILEDYEWWFECIPQNKQSEAVDFVGREMTEQELRQLTERMNHSVHAIVDSANLSDLSRSYVVKGVDGNGKPYSMTTCLADIIWHMVEEQLQHIGELNALFWQMNIDPPTSAWFSSELSWTH
jgi:uncharacterized damage-inducible protein DinB